MVRIFTALLFVVTGCGDSDGGSDAGVGLDAGQTGGDVDASTGEGGDVDAGRDAAFTLPEQADGGGAFCDANEECDDGRFCTGVEACVVGRCAPGDLVDCDDDVACTLDRCDDELKACVNQPDHEQCDDGNARICDEGRGCIEVTCDSAKSCDDKLSCNGVESCPDGFCDGGEAPDVDDGIECTLDVCDEDGGGAKQIPRDAMCDDGTFCNGVEVCDPTQGCLVGPGEVVDDGIECTVDACDEETKTTTHTAKDSMCADSDECTVDGCDVVMGCVHESDATACPCAPAGVCSPFEDADCSGQACRPKGIASSTECQDVTGPVLSEGDVCDQLDDGQRCERGTYCLALGADLQRCRRMCPKDSIDWCADGEACSATIGDSCLLICKAFPEPCDPYAQDCADVDDTCIFATHPESGEHYTGCRPAGPQNRGDPCGGSNGTCGHGLVCVSVLGDPRCREICDLDDGVPGCTDEDEACDGLSTNYGVTYCL